MQEHNPYQAPSADFSVRMGEGDHDETPVYSAGGRFGRLSYLAWSGVIGIIYIVVIAVLAPSLLIPLNPEATEPPVALMGLLLVLCLPMIYFGIVFAVRRLHDINMSGWWALAIIVPLANLIMFLVLLFMPGTAGGNRFGPPRLTRTWEQIFAWIYIALMVVGFVGQFYLLATVLA